jgi:hypothetical protein
VSGVLHYANVNRSQYERINIMATTNAEASEQTVAEKVQAKYVKDIMDEMKKREGPYQEYMELQALHARLTGGPDGGSAATPIRRRQARAGSGTRSTGSGNRRHEFVSIVNSNPDGLTIAEIADQMGIEGNYLYRIGKDLETEKQVVKGDDKRYRPVT